MPWSSKVAGRTAQLRTAQAALQRYQNRAWARKADVPPFERQRQREQDRADLKVAVEILEPIVGEYVRGCVEADREAEAAKAEAARSGGHGYFAPQARIGEGPQARPEAASLEGFKAEIADILASSPDRATAQSRVQRALAIEASRLALRGSK